ncbi:MAG: hypothetical protein GX226_00300 [Dehalococcoidales bacterium]|nr:hypothetical protein [Dehalococcoidales bacterium]
MIHLHFFNIVISLTCGYRRLHTYERENVTDVIKVRKTVNRLAEIVTGN